MGKEVGAGLSLPRSGAITCMALVNVSKVLILKQRFDTCNSLLITYDILGSA